MIIWFVLFFIILSISFILAYFSMKDYQEVPSGESDYGVYLLRKPQFLTTQILSAILKLSKGKIVSLERLFKGETSALVIFGPRNSLERHFGEILGLLELEDYTKVSGEFMSWEFGKKAPLQNLTPFNNFPRLLPNEHFWWQINILSNERESGNYSGQLRAVLISPDKERLDSLVSKFQESIGGFLVKLPTPFTSSQILEFYRQRIISPANTITLKTEEVILLTGFPHK